MVLMQLLDARNLFPEDRVITVGAVKISFGKISVVAIRVLPLDDGSANPWGGAAGMAFSGADEFGIATTVRSSGEFLYGYPEQILREENDQILELLRTQVF